MDEMQLLRELGDRTPLATRNDLAPARAALLAKTKPKARKRFAIYGAAVAAMAAAIFAVFALIPPSHSGTENVSGPARNTGENTGGVTGARNDDPVQVLRLAATSALQTKDITPRSDQFVYIKTQFENGSVREDWFSVDGTHDGLFKMQTGEDMPVPGCRNGKMAVYKGPDLLPGKTDDCEPNPAYRPDLPTDAAGMIKYLRKGNASLNSTAKDISFLLSSIYMRPQSRAALFEAATKIEGLTATPGVTDAAGRQGIQIGWNKDGYSGDFIVDAKTYAYLGYRKNEAQMAMAIVDKVGQRP
ncbi:hypothetical protein JOF56_004768 [Kibdelosporangium banguiense]|uniref:Uncharacterized protein n=1 Tax=Kibdelosporangium banguiense TaxID=1365924 RepID=A0ABS4TKG3_9PSEU|nr:CU044_5270 family protein [Kibdelosporangium banguiense]MBP2324383.1 hypothetical protein [Kibdelosporangium banguiense]